MRVTFNQIQGSLDAINLAAAQFARAQQQVASGKKSARPSDDPLSAERGIQDTAEISTIDGYSQSSDSAGARLSVLDGALSSMVDILTSAQATTAGAHGSTFDQVTRDTSSAKILGLRDALAGALNTKIRGVYVFGGSEAQVQPYDNTNASSAWVYSGNATEVSVDSAPNRNVSLSMDGQAIAKGTDAVDVLTVLDSLAADVKSGNEAGITTGMDALGRAFTRVVRAQSQVGTDEASVVDGQTQIASLRLAAMTRLSSDQNVNMAEAITAMTRAQTAYQAALGAVGTASKQSLLDYIR
jgi:flagellar hook-associated protein 3 FlgL